MRAHRIATACKGAIWGYPGNCQFSSYAQCMATASGTDAYCGINPQYAFARQRRGDYRPDTERQRSTVAPDIEQRFRCYDVPVDFLKLWETTPANISGTSLRQLRS